MNSEFSTNIIIMKVIFYLPLFALLFHSHLYNYVRSMTEGPSEEFMIIGSGSCYIEQSEPKPWSAAKSSCEEVGGSLMKMDNQQEEAMIQEKLGMSGET